MNETTLKIAESEADREIEPAPLPWNGDQARSSIEHSTTLPARSPDLTIRDLANGFFVVQAPQSADFLQLGEEEHFLLAQLDGETDAATICSRYADRFGQTLSQEDLEGFLELAQEQHLLCPDISSQGSSLAGAGARGAHANPPLSTANSLLYWRKNIFDPDSLFSWMVPRIRFVWTRTFLVLSMGVIVFAVVLDRKSVV